MNTKETLGQFFMNRIRRSVIASIGLLTYALGVYFQLQADLGMQPWQAMRLGLANQLNVTFGTVSIVMSLILIVIDLFLKQRIGLGTFLDAFLVGIGVDICIYLDFLPLQTNLGLQVGWLFAGMVVCAIGQWFYMTAALLPSRNRKSVPESSDRYGKPGNPGSGSCDLFRLKEPDRSWYRINRCIHRYDHGSGI